MHSCTRLTCNPSAAGTDSTIYVQPLPRFDDSAKDCVRVRDELNHVICALAPVTRGDFVPSVFPGLREWIIYNLHMSALFRYRVIERPGRDNGRVFVVTSDANVCENVVDEFLHSRKLCSGNEDQCAFCYESWRFWKTELRQQEHALHAAQSH